MCRHFFVLSFSFTFVARNLKVEGWLGEGKEWLLLSSSLLLGRVFRPHKDDTGSRWNILGVPCRFRQIFHCWEKRIFMGNKKGIINPIFKYMNSFFPFNSIGSLVESL